MWTVERLKNELEKISTRVGDIFDISVSINPRLIKTHGRCNYKINNLSGECIPVSIEMSKILLKTTTDEDIIQVLKHEWAHYYVTKKTKCKHGHDNYFKDICAKIGCSHSASRGAVEQTTAPENIYKYTVYCPRCGFLGGYSRMCQTLKTIQFCICKQCNGKGLYYKQNK